MKHFFSEVDDVTLTFSDIQRQGGMEYIRIYFEKPIDNDFAFLESTLPALNIVATEHFSPTEQQQLLQYARTNAFLIWDMARDKEDKSA